MNELSEKEHWDSLHTNEQKQWETENAETSTTVKVPFANKVVRRLKSALLSKRLREKMSPYDHFLLWEVILPKYVKESKSDKIIEIGSAPGEFLVQFREKFGHNPFGVEYSESGIKLNREVFKKAGIDPEQVVFADVFDEKFQENHFEKFEIVISRGFIEHFTDVREVLEKHLALVKDEGLLIVLIPNLRGINGTLTTFFNPPLMPIHNLEIMKPDEFSNAFKFENLSPLFCRYYGKFSFFLFYAENKFYKKLLMNICYKFQPLLDLYLHTFFGKKGIEKSKSGPYLLFIGRKQNKNKGK